MNNMKFTGLIVALVTPFKDDGSVDYDSLKKLLDWHLESGTDGIVCCGTTGEKATLEEGEFFELVKTTVKHINGKIPVIAGSGTNCTKHTIELSKKTLDCGVDALLIVGPYYNKPTQDGYLAHYSQIAKEINLPIIIYNVPGRTAGNILPQTVSKLATISNIVGIKEASGNLDQICEIINTVPKNFSVLSGDDLFTLPIMALGGHGCISVVANEIPKIFKEMITHLFKNDYLKAREIHYKILSLMKINFIETNPIPVKTALYMMGKIKENFRLPLVKMNDENKLKLKKILEELKLI
jgi:4-hydroxy-tetrahydrodipicolinate synthase